MPLPYCGCSNAEKGTENVANNTGQAEEEMHHAKRRILLLQKNMRTASEMNDNASINSTMSHLQRYRELGYNIDTGEYDGIQNQIGQEDGLPPLSPRYPPLSPKR